MFVKENSKHQNLNKILNLQAPPPQEKKNHMFIFTSHTN